MDNVSHPTYYSGRNITASFSYVTERGGREDGKGKGYQDGKESV
jgi:hypothetical protein